MAGELTLTHYGTHKVSGAALKSVVDTIVLAAATDFLFLVPVGNGQVSINKVVRAA